MRSKEEAESTEEDGQTDGWTDGRTDTTKSVRFLLQPSSGDTIYVPVVPGSF